jgi:RNA polymerase sigma factor (sigma-70 family)
MKKVWTKRVYHLSYLAKGALLEISITTAKAFLEGEGTAVQEVYETYRKLLYFIIVSIVKDKSDAEDLFQDVFVEVLSNKNASVKPAKLRNYLCECAKNKALNFIKKRNALVDYTDLMDIYEMDESDNPYLQNLLEGLTDLENVLVSYKIVYGFSYREIERLTGLKRQNANNIYRRAIHKLRKLYGDKPHVQ